MNSVSMNGSLRDSVGSKGASALRNEGMVPCVIYGAENPIHVAIDERQFNKIIFTSEVFVINLDVDGTKYDVVLKDTQFHPVTDKLIHADFFLPKAGEKVTLSIPVKLNGTSPGVLNGGRLRLVQRKLSVNGLVEDMPEYIEVDISKLRINMGVRVSDVRIKGLELLDSPNNYVVFVKTARGALDEEEEEEAVEGEGEAAAEGGEAPAAEAPAEG